MISRRHLQSVFTLRSSSLRLVALLFFCFPFSLWAQQSGGAAPSGPQVRLVRSVIGAKGESRNGSFVITEARANFYPPTDHEVIAYFEWEGSKGKHHCEGSVRGPNGEFAVMSSFDYNALQSRFAGFWKMPLSESTPPGNWVFESKVDGEAAGQVTFQIIPGEKPTNASVAASLPTPAEVYKRSLASIVQVDSLDPSGKTLRRSLGFIWKSKQILTSFRSVDGASSLRLRFPDGKELRAAELLGWNRRQDWAIVPADVDILPLNLADPKSGVAVGDPCYWIDVKDDSSRILAQGQIVGVQSPLSWGDRLDLSGTFSYYANGGPVLSERGQIVAFLGGALPASFLTPFIPMVRTELLEPLYAPMSGTAVPVSLLPTSAPTQPVTLQELWAKGQMTPPLTNYRLVQYGILGAAAKSSERTSRLISQDPKVSFQHSDSAAGVTISFRNAESIKTTTQLNLYDIDNHLLATGKQQKLSISREEFAQRYWQFPIDTLPPGFYRVDLIVGDAVAWRQYFKLAD